MSGNCYPMKHQTNHHHQQLHKQRDALFSIKIHIICITNTHYLETFNGKLQIIVKLTCCALTHKTPKTKQSYSGQLLENMQFINNFNRSSQNTADDECLMFSD